MNVSHDKQELRSLLEQLVPHGPENPITIGTTEFLLTRQAYRSALSNGTDPMIADGIYLIVTLNMTNTGTRPVTIEPAMYRIDNGTNTFEPDTDAMDQYMDQGDGTGRHTDVTGEIAPGTRGKAV